MVRRRQGDRRGFSLQELMVVVAIVVLLTGLLMPALGHVRENAHRVVCASNQRQLGLAMFMYHDEWDQLPLSKWLEAAQVGEPMPLELMSANNLMAPGQNGQPADPWDGLGLLFRWYYCDVPSCFYCPSHHGFHPEERYADLWRKYSPMNPPTTDSIYTNYHYAGHKDWETMTLRRLSNASSAAILTDGLRTKSDFNHRVGMNVLKQDGSVVWNDDTEGIYEKLPDDEFPSDAELSAFREVWSDVEEAASPGGEKPQSD